MELFRYMFSNAGVKLIKWASGEGERDALFLEAGTALTYTITETSISKVTA